MTEAILDAARTVFEQYGARRANVDDVAQAAGVSRATLYRTYPGKDALLAAVIDRETAAFFDELDRVAADLPPGEAVVECFVRGLAIMRDIPVLGRLSVSEPEMLTGRPDRSSVLVSQADRVARTLRRSGATRPDAELHLAAELLLRLASTFLIDPGGSLDVADEKAVRRYAEQFLSPLVT